MKEVFVIGAGIGGLTTASMLVKNGYSVEIFEKMRASPNFKPKKKSAEKGFFEKVKEFFQ